MSRAEAESSGCLRRATTGRECSHDAPCTFCAVGGANGVVAKQPPCWQCSHAGLDCDYSYPCTDCVRRKVACSWPTVEPNRIPHFLGPIRLSYGAAGSARLDAKYEKNGRSVRMEWQAAVEQREDLRLVQHSKYLPTMLCPPSAILDGEQEEFDRISNRLDKAPAGELLDRALSPQTPIPSTLLLNTLLRTRPSKISNTASSSILNSGNCLAVLNLDSSGTRRKERNTSAAFWRIGDDSGRPNAVGMGVFEEQHPDDMLVKLSRFDKFGRFDDLPPFKINHRKPICSTPAPILQIQATPLISSNLLAIRTATSIAFHRTRGIDDIVRQAAAPVYEFTGREMNRRSIADMVLGGIDGGDAGSGLVVDVEGGLFGFGLGTAGSMAYISRTGAPQKPTMYVLRRGRRKENYSGFAKVVWGGSRGLDAVVGLEDEVLVFDLRSPKSSLSLITSSQLTTRGPLVPKSQPNLITSLANPQSSTPFRAFSSATETPTPIHTICTTSDIVWLDERMPGKDVLRWGHDRMGRNGRGLDRTLQIMKLPSQPGESNGIESTSRLVLHSKIHSHLSFYTYSSSGTSPVRSLLDPYSLPSPSPSSDRPWTRAGLSITPCENSLRRSSKGFHHDGDDPIRRDPGWIILESGVHGDLHSRFVTLAEQEETPNAGKSRRSWLPAMEEQGIAADGAGTYRYEPKRAPEVVEREVELLDLRLAYRGIFGEAAKPVGVGAVVRESVESVVVEDEEMEDDLEANSSAQILSEVVSRTSKMKALLSEEVDNQKRDAVADVGVLTGYEVATFTNESLQSDSTEIDPLPRPTTFLSPLAPSIHSFPPTFAPSLLESTTQAMEWIVPWSIQPFSEATSQTEKFRAKYMPDLPKDWATLMEQAEVLKKRYGVSRVIKDKYGAPKHSSPHPLGAACEQVVMEIALASHLYSARSIVDAPATLDTPNTPFPLNDTPPPIHFSFFRPQISANFKDRPEEKTVGLTRNTKRRILRPSLESTGARSVLSEWQIGSDPSLYKFTNPYHEETKDKEMEEGTQQTREESQRRDKGKRRAEEPVESSRRDPPSSSQFVFGAGSSGFPPSLQSRRINPILEEPPSFASSNAHTTDRFTLPTNRLGRNTASQPLLQHEMTAGSSQSGGESQSQMGMATQVLPGPFGGRIEKKKVKKKRISGF